MDRRFTLTNMTCSQTIDVKFKDLSFAVQAGYRKPKKQILNGLTGYFRSRELTGIMGPSGAGKTTLLNILSGFQEGLYTGTVEYLNKSGKQSRNNCKKQLCYIQQTDNVHDFFTIYETMMIASYLKINWSISRESRQTLINDILKTLNLSYHKDTRVDRLSGGQKKRLSIALELIDNPPLMFLDEPTTGLDSLSSMQCVTTLKTLARAGRTIICTIHQPSAALYEIFDHIYLVVDGYCMYRSSPGDTVDYFAQQGLQCPKYHNPADYMLEVVTKEYGNYDEQLIAAAQLLAEPNDKARSIKLSCDMIQDMPEDDRTMIITSPPTELIKFWVLLQRFALLIYRDRMTLQIKLIFHFLVAILLGLFYEHAGDDASKTVSNLGCMLVSAVYLYYTSMMSAALKFSFEIDILRKERFNNWYQLRTYFMAMLVCTLPLQITFGLIHSLVYFMTSQPLEFFRFFMYLCIIILTNIVSEGMGLGLGALFNPVNGTFIGSITLCVMMSLGGFLIFFKHMTSFMYYLSYLNVIRYIYHGLLQSIYSNRGKIFCSINYCHFRVPDMIMEELDFTKMTFWLDIVVLFIHFFMFWILAYMLLKKRLSKVC